MWSFETDPDFSRELDWIDTFVRQEVQPLDHVLGNQYEVADPGFVRLVRPLQVHGSLGLSSEMPFTDWLVDSFHVGLADGPTEVHKQVVARERYGMPQGQA